MKTVKQWFARQKSAAHRPVHRVSAAPLMLALEPRLVYDASIAAVATTTHVVDKAAVVAAVTTAPGGEPVATSGGGDSGTVVAPNVGVEATPVAPVLSLSTTGSGSVSFVAGDNAASTPVVIDSGISIDNTTGAAVSSAEVAIVGDPSSTDLLALGANVGTGIGHISGSYDATTGVLTLSSSVDESAEAWTNALNDVTYTNTSVTPDATARTINFTVSNGSTTSQVLADTVTVTDTDQAPIVRNTAGTTAFTSGENVVSVIVDAGTSVSDSDSTTLSSATVSIVGNFQEGQDILALQSRAAGDTTLKDISASYNKTTGVLSLSSKDGLATLQEWQEALDSVIYTDTAATPTPGTRLLTFSVTDSDGVAASVDSSKSVVVSEIATPYSAPTLTASSSSEILLPSGGVSLIDGKLTLHDSNVSASTLVSMRIDVQFTTGYESGDNLALASLVTLPMQLTTSVDPTSGELAITSSSGGTIAEWQSVLDAIEFTTSSSSASDTRAINVTISDNTSVSAPASYAIVANLPAEPLALSQQASTVSNIAGQATTVLDSGLTLTDKTVDDTTAVSLALTVAGLSTGDAITFITPTGVEVQTSAVVDGVETITASATIAQWNSLLETIAFSTAVGSPAGERTLALAVTGDASGDSASANYVVDVTAVPVLTSTTGEVSNVVGQGATVLDKGLTLTDNNVDAANAIKLTLTISGLEASDVMTFTSAAGSIDTVGAGALPNTKTITADVTLAEWNNILESLAFSTSANASVRQRTLTLTIQDDADESASVNYKVDVATAPVLSLSTTSSGSVAFAAGDNAVSTPVVIDSGISIDNTTGVAVSGAEVSIVGDPSSSDLLALGTNVGTGIGHISGSYDATTGVLTLSSSVDESAAAWTNALNDVTYTNTSVTPATTERTINFTVSNGSTISQVLADTVSVADTDQTPILTAGTTSDVAYVEGQVATVLDAHLALTDNNVDATAKTPLTVTVSGLAADDAITFATPAGLSVQASGVVGGTETITASATVTEWNSILESLAFSTPASASVGSRPLTLTIQDGAGQSASVNYTVNVSLAPVLSLSTTGSGSVSFVAGDNAASTPVVIDSGISIDNTTGVAVSSAEVAIVGNPSSTDLLALGTNVGTGIGHISGSYDATKGVLTLSSSVDESAEAWTNALNDVTYTNTSVTPATTERAIQFGVSNGSTTSLALQDVVTVVDTDQTPQLAGGGNTITFTSTDNTTSTPVFIDSSITVSDASATATAATVSIGSGFQAGEDVLGFTANTATMGDIVQVTSDDGPGTLTLQSAGGMASTAQWDAALQAVTYSDTSATPDTTTPRTISFTVKDGTAISSALTSAVTVTQSEQQAVVVDSGITVADLGINSPASATVQIGSGFNASEDVLGLPESAAIGNIKATYDPAHGTLTLTSQDDLATAQQWQAALVSVTYVDSAALPDTTGRTISFSVTDSNGVATDVASTAVGGTTTPSLGNGGNTVAYVPNLDATVVPRVVVNSGITVNNADGATLQTATVTIVGDPESTDVLAFQNTSRATYGNITSSYLDGVLTLSLTASGTATLTQWTAALEAVQYESTSRIPATEDRTVSFAVSTDGVSYSSPVTTTITVTDANDNPVLGNGGNTIAYVADLNAATPIGRAVNSDITVSDTHGVTLQSATISITAGLDSADLLVFHNTSESLYGHITSTYADGVLTLSLTGSGTTTLMQWQNALEAVMYESTNQLPATEVRTISFAVSTDGVSFSAPVTTTVNVTDANDNPVLGNGGNTVFYVADTNATTPPVLTVDSGVTVTDTHDVTLQTATVSITDGFSVNDVLAFHNTSESLYGFITSTYSNGVLTLTLTGGGTTTLAQWQNALEAVTYDSSSTKPTAGNRVISFAVSTDSENFSAPVTTTMTVVGTPILDFGDNTTNYNPGDDVAVPRQLFINEQLVIADPSDIPLETATVSITGNLETGDALRFVNSSQSIFGDISGVYSASTGVLTLTSSDPNDTTLAQWQAALQAVTYSSDKRTPTTDPRTISFAVSNGINVSATVITTIFPVDIDQTPILTDTAGTTAFVSTGPLSTLPVDIDSTIQVTDYDNATEAAATVSIGTGFVAGEDVLAFTNISETMGNIVASYNASTGVMTLTSMNASASKADWANALASVTYADTATAPTTGTRTIDFSISDGINASAILTRDVVVTGSGTAFGQHSLPFPDAGDGIPALEPIPTFESDSTSLATDLPTLNTGGSAQAIVLNTFVPPLQIGSIASPTTYTFAAPGTRPDTLGETHVTPLESLVPRGLESDIAALIARAVQDIDGQLLQPGNRVTPRVAPLAALGASMPAPSYREMQPAHDESQRIAMANAQIDVSAAARSAAAHAAIRTDPQATAKAPTPTVANNAVIGQASSGKAHSGKASLSAQFAHARAALHVARIPLNAVDGQHALTTPEHRS